ncbi:MAG TPA: dual specificity protein phosphatase [Anaerolineales bacterium]|nr:dual specificity protein phosphatase [Anaerolineales bacterium]
MDFSRITDDLFIGDTPKAEDYDFLRDLGVRLIINMRFEKRPAADRHHEPLDFLWLPTLDTPGLVIPIRYLVRGVQRALETIQSGGKVYAHCQRGRHRGVAMGASILIALGYDPDQAMQLIKVQRPIADPDIFYIRSRILRFARAWQTID